MAFLYVLDKNAVVKNRSWVQGSVNWGSLDRSIFGLVVRKHNLTLQKSAHSGWTKGATTQASRLHGV